MHVYICGETEPNTTLFMNPIPHYLYLYRYTLGAMLWGRVKRAEYLQSSYNVIIFGKKFNSPIAKNMSFTFIAVFADVSINNKLFSSAYAWASCNEHTQLQTGTPTTF